MELLCAFCIIVRPKDVSKAVTIVSGHAVCFDHTYHIQGGAFAKALEQIKIDEGLTKLKVDLIENTDKDPFKLTFKTDINTEIVQSIKEKMIEQLNINRKSDLDQKKF